MRATTKHKDTPIAQKDTDWQKIKKRARLGLIVVSIIFVAYSVLFIFRSSFVLSDGKRYFCLHDDAMISMRYAWNWSHGLGLVWNAGERVEGYTNPLMVALMSIVSHFFDKRLSCLVVQVLGIGILLGCAFLCSRIIMQLMRDDDRNTPDKYHRNTSMFRPMCIILGFSAPLLYYPLVYWALMGMETGLLTLILLTITYIVFKWGESLGVGRVLAIAVLCGLAYLTRPDAVVPVAILFAYLFVRLIRALGVLRAGSWMTVIVLVFGIIIAAHLTFRWFYYGQLMPNTYILKATGMSRLQYIQNGWLFVRNFFNAPSSGLFILTLLACFFSCLEKRLTILLMFASLVGYEIYIGGDPFPLWRIMCPAVPSLLLVAIVELRRLVLFAFNSTLRQKRFRASRILLEKYVLVPLIAVLFLIVITGLNWHFMTEIRTFQPYQANYNRDNCEKAIAILTLTRPEASVGVLWAGAIPYYTGRRAIDFLGKCDAVIARLAPNTSPPKRKHHMGMFTLPGHNKYDLNYSIKKLMPDYVQGGFYIYEQDIRNWARNHYVTVYTGHAGLSFKRGSPNVLWHKLKPYDSSRTDKP